MTLNSIQKTPGIRGEKTTFLSRREGAADNQHSQKCYGRCGQSASRTRSSLGILSSYSLGVLARKLSSERGILWLKAHSKVGCSYSQNLGPLHPGPGGLGSGPRHLPAPLLERHWSPGRADRLPHLPSSGISQVSFDRTSWESQVTIRGVSSG